MSTDPPHSPDDDFDDGADDAADDLASLEFLRDIARVEERSPPSHTERLRLEGTNIGRFKVISEIGRGGMGIVFLAEDEALRRKVALKLLPPSFAADAERRRRFLREARAAAAVSHPNLVTVYDVGEHEGRAYIAMEYLRGRSLRDMLSERPFTVDESVEYAKQVLAGLAHAHAAGLLHRDLKPENVLVDRDNRVRLVDFGLAKLDGDHDPREMSGANSTRDGLVMGTPGYMSPEQARGQNVDARSDIFSFGVLLYEMLTRKRPFAGPTRADILSALLRDEAPRVSALRPEVCNSLADVVARCLAKSPDDRYPSATALSQALEDAWTVSKSGSEHVAEKTITTGPTPVNADSAPPTKPSRWKWLPPAFAAAAAIFLVVRMRAQSDPAVTPPSNTISIAATDGGAKKGIAITDLPAPKSNSQAALAAYRQAMQAIRDADWSIADDRLRAAVREDPEFSAAYLRLAMIGGTGNGGPLKPREDLSQAMSSRANLSARDQELLMAFEAVISRPQTERHVAKERLRKLVEKYPDDADLWHVFAVFGSGTTADAVAAERKATSLDPQFADAWQILGQNLARGGNIDEALAAIEKCVVISPLSADCRAERARIYSLLGDCTRMEEDLRHGMEANPRAASIWQDLRAASLLAVGRGDDTILEAFRQKWALVPPERRAGVEQYDRALLATARGRFVDAESALTEGDKAIAADTSLDTHEKYAELRGRIEMELGHPKETAKVAQAFIARHDLLVPSHEVGDPEIAFRRLLMHGGLLSKADFEQRRDEWWSQVAKRPGEWSAAWGAVTSTEAEATDALRVYDGLSEKLAVACEKSTHEISDYAVLGHVYLLAGKAESAVAPLEMVTTQCNWLTDPLEMTQALLELGKAHEVLGNTENACEAYQRVIARWSAAKKSATLDVAKARVKALMCGAEARRSPAPPALRGPHIEQDRMDDDADEEDLHAQAVPPPPPMPHAPPAPPTPPTPQTRPTPSPPPTPTAPPAPTTPSTPFVPRTRLGVGVLQGSERDKTCSDAKKVAIREAECAKPRSIEGNCDCHDLPGGWICTAMMAVTCN